MFLWTNCSWSIQSKSIFYWQCVRYNWTWTWIHFTSVHVKYYNIIFLLNIDKSSVDSSHVLFLMTLLWKNPPHLNTLSQFDQTDKDKVESKCRLCISNKDSHVWKINKWPYAYYMTWYFTGYSIKWVVIYDCMTDYMAISKLQFVRCSNDVNGIGEIKKQLILSSINSDLLQVCWINS